MKKLLLLLFISVSMNCIAAKWPDYFWTNTLWGGIKYPNGTIDTVWKKKYQLVKPRTDEEAEPIIRYYNRFYDRCKVIPMPKTIYPFTPTFVK